MWRNRIKLPRTETEMRSLASLAICSASVPMGSVSQTFVGVMPCLSAMQDVSLTTVTADDS